MTIIASTKRARKIKSIRHRYGRNATHELLISRSNFHISAYVIDLDNYNVLFSVSSMGKENMAKKISKMEKAASVGNMIGKICCEKKLSPVINVAQYKFHGRVKALVEAFMEQIRVSGC